MHKSFLSHEMVAPISPEKMTAGDAAAGRRRELRRDAVFNRWVIVSPARGRRPSDFSSASSTSPSPTSSSCAFCAGRERECAPEIFRQPPGSHDWKVRVIQNLYPALDREVEEEGSSDGGGRVGSVMAGFGVHDVVIETPEHGVRMWDLSAEEVGGVLLAFRERVSQLEARPALKYVQVFKNHGAQAGASLSHSHSQIMGLPLVPPLVTSRLSNMEEHFKKAGKCGICELGHKELVVDESTYFYSIVPFAAAYPFEIWIVPKEHFPHFHKLDDEKLVDLGGLLKLTLSKLFKQLKDPPFNLMIHTSPFQCTSSTLAFSHWFLQIVPHLSVLGGFELGSGCYINPVFPEDAAKVLRELDGF